MDIISMAYAKKLVNGLQSGLDTASVDNDTCSITFHWKNGTSSTMTFPKPLDGANGVGISDVKLKEVTVGSSKETHLICTLDDGTEIDAGNIAVGSEGTTDYADLINKPSINSIELSGNKTLTDLGITNYDDTEIKKSINTKASTTDLTAHTSDTGIHITSSERTKWNNKAEMSDIPSLTNYATKTYVTDEIAKAATSGKVDLTGYATTIEVDNKLAGKADKTEIPDISNLATKDELSTHTDNSSIHVTANDKNNWNNKLDASALDAYTTTDDLNSALALKADKDELFSGDYNDLANKPTIPDTSNLATKGQLDSHISNTAMHVTTDEKTTWNNKLDADALDSYVKHTELDTHINDSDIHITVEERNEWNDKLDNTALNGYATETFVTEKITEAVTSGTVDLTDYAKTVDVNASLSTKVDKVDGKSLVSDAEITRLSKISNYDDADIKTSITNINTTLDTKANKSELFSGSYNDLADKPIIPSLDDYAKTVDVDTKLDTKVDKIDGKELSTNDYTTEEKTKVEKIKTDGTGTAFLANDGTYKKVSSSASAVAERKFKPSFGFDTYWGEIRDTKGNKNQVDLATIKTQIDKCEEMKVDKIICTLHIAWNETTNSLVIAENTDSLLSAISYCENKNVTIDTVKVHMQLKGTSTSINNYVNNTIGMSTFKTAYKSMLTTICNLFKNTTVTRITILNEMWYITNSSLGYSTFINECLNLVKNAGYSTGITMAGFTSNQKLADAVIQNIDTFYINVYPGISGSGSYITKQEAIESFNQCDIDLWIGKLKKKYPNKKVIISEMGTNDYWECLAAPSSWDVTGATKTGGYAVDTYITAMMEFFINNNVEIEELWWWYDLYYEPVKKTLLNYLGGDR